MPDMLALLFAALFALAGLFAGPAFAAPMRYECYNFNDDVVCCNMMLPTSKCWQPNIDHLFFSNRSFVHTVSASRGLSQAVCMRQYIDVQALNFSSLHVHPCHRFLNTVLLCLQHLEQSLI